MKRDGLLFLLLSFDFQVSQKVQEALTERAASFGLILDDISLVRISCFRNVLCTVLLEMIFMYKIKA